MQHLEVSGAVVLYIERTVSKGQSTHKWRTTHTKLRKTTKKKLHILTLVAMKPTLL
jgi:hypothetical protein